MIETKLTTRHGRQPADSVFHHLAAAVSDDRGWHKARQRKADWPTCGYCGSLPADVLLQLRDQSRVLRIDRADWKYGWPHKVYVEIKNDRPDELYVISAITHEPREGDRDGYWTPVGAKERADLVRDGWGGSDYRFVHYATRPTLRAKYYAIHALDDGLTDEQRRQLAYVTGYWIEDAGDGRIRWRAYDYGSTVQASCNA